MSFQDKNTTKAGNLGERIAHRKLKAGGYIVYRYDQDAGPHPIDGIAIHRTQLKVLLFDVKAKPKRVKYNDTGIDLDEWQKYRQLGRFHNMRVFLVFVDWEAARVYGQFLDVLDKIRPAEGLWGFYPKTENNGTVEIRYFPLCAMKEISELTADEAEELRQLSQRADVYGGKERQLSMPLVRIVPDNKA